MDAVTVVTGVVIVLVAGWVAFRAWRRVGLRVTQRWALTVWCVVAAVLFGGTLVLFPLRQPALSAVWSWVSFVTILMAGLAAVAIGFGAQLGAISARRRDTELGVPTEPRPATFWFPFIGWALLLSFVAIFAAWPWVFVTVWSESMQQGVPMDTRDDRLWLAVVVPTIFMLAVAALLVGGRFLLRQRRIREHAVLLEGIRSRERASYEAGYNDGRHDRGTA